MVSPRCLQLATDPRSIGKNRTNTGRDSRSCPHDIFGVSGVASRHHTQMHLFPSCDCTLNLRYGTTTRAHLGHRLYKTTLPITDSRRIIKIGAYTLISCALDINNLFRTHGATSVDQFLVHILIGVITDISMGSDDRGRIEKYRVVTRMKEIISARFTINWKSLIQIFTSNEEKKTHKTRIILSRLQKKA